MMRVTSLLFVLAPLWAQSDALDTGLAAYNRGDYPTAETALRQSNDPQAKLFLALTLAATNRCAEALTPLKEGFHARRPAARLAGLALAQCHISAKEFDEASSVLASLKENFPNDADVLYLAARLHMQAWNDTLYQLYKVAPGSYRVNQISGEILETQGQFTAAAAEYRKAIEKNPEAVNLHFRLGRALLMGSHSPETLEAGLKEFEAELKHNPRDPVALYQIAVILLAQNKPADAAVKLEQAIAIDGHFAEAMIALGKQRLAEKPNHEAIRLLTRAVELQPKNETAHYNLMLAYRNAGRLEDARKEKVALDAIQKPPEGEFSDFLKKLGEKPTPAK